MPKKGGSKAGPMEMQVGRKTGVIVMTDDEMEKQEEMYNVFGTKKRNKDGSPVVEKLLDVVGYVSQLESTQDEADASTRKPKVDSYRPQRKSFANRKPRPEIDPALARIPQACLGTIFANGRKQSDKIAREAEGKSKLLEMRIDCPKCYKRSCRNHRNGRRHFNWRSNCPYCRMLPCDQHGNRSQWQQTDFPLCPHISMQLFWTIDDPTNSRDEWGFSVTPVVGDEAEHEECKGSIKGVQYNVDNLGAMVRERMDKMGLRGPPNVGRVIRRMPRFLQTPEVEINHEVRKKERDEELWEEEQDDIIKKKDGDTIRNGGLTIELLEGDDGRKNPRKTPSKSEPKSSPVKKPKEPQATSCSEKEIEAPTKEETPVKDKTAEQKTTKEDEREPTKDDKQKPKKEETPKPTKKDEPSATANAGQTSKADSINKVPDKKKVPLSEELIYDSDEGLSDVEQKEAEKVKKQEKTLVSDNERPTKKGDMKKAPKADQSKIEDDKPRKRKLSDSEDLSEAEVQQSSNKKRKVSEVEQVPEVEPERVEENTSVKRKASEMNEEAEAKVQQPPTKKRKASEEGEISEDSESGDLEPKKVEEQSLINLESSEVNGTVEVQQPPNKKRKASEVDDTAGPPTKKRKASEEGEISECSESGDVEPKKIEEHSSTSHEVYKVNSAVEMQLPLTEEINTSEVGGVADLEPEEVKEKNTLTKCKASEVDDTAEVQQPPNKKRKASEEGEISEASESEDTKQEKAEEQSLVNLEALEVDGITDLEPKEIEERTTLSKCKASETDDTEEVQQPPNKKRKASEEGEISEDSDVADVEPKEAEGLSEDKPQEVDEQTPVESKAPETNDVLADEPQQVEEKVLIESKTLEAEIVSENKPQKVEATSEDKPQGAEEHSSAKRKASEVDDEEEQPRSKKRKVTGELKRK